MSSLTRVMTTVGCVLAALLVEVASAGPPPTQGLSATKVPAKAVHLRRRVAGATAITRHARPGEEISALQSVNGSRAPVRSATRTPATSR
jgi:hypothetical protein